MNSEYIVYGGLQWVSVGMQYGMNQFVWVVMLVVKMIYIVCKRFVLNVDFFGFLFIGYIVLFGYVCVIYF